MKKLIILTILLLPLMGCTTKTDDLVENPVKTNTGETVGKQLVYKEQSRVEVKKRDAEDYKSLLHECDKYTVENYGDRLENLECVMYLENETEEQAECIVQCKEEL